MREQRLYGTRSGGLGAREALSIEHGRIEGAIPPMLAVLGGEPFDSAAHIFEVKWDGVRALAFMGPAEVRLQDRYLRDVTDRYPELRGLGRQVPGGGTVLDGEVVALDEAGRPDFSRLRERLGARDAEECRRLAARTPVIFQAFDILYCQGRSTMEYPLWRRKKLLHEMVRPERFLGVPDFVMGEGVAFLEAARRHELEGIVAKERESVYLPGERSPAWQKLKVYQKEEFVVGGFTYGGRWSSSRRRRPREPFASLLLGLYDGQGQLLYVGEVAGGFTPESALEIVGALDSLVSAQSPFQEEPRLQRLVFWCRPELVASVRFGEWTRQRRLRFPVFECLRPDVPASFCRFDAVRG